MLRARLDGTVQPCFQRLALQFARMFRAHCNLITVSRIDLELKDVQTNCCMVFWSWRRQNEVQPVARSPDLSIHTDIFAISGSASNANLESIVRINSRP